MTLLLLSGRPGAGKTEVGKWLKTRHDFVYIETDTDPEWAKRMFYSQTAKAAAATRDKALARGPKVVIEWGFRNTEVGVRDCGLSAVNGQCELRTGGQVSSGSADTKSPGVRTVSASPPGADSVNAGQAAPVRAAVTATVVYRIVKLPPTASMAAPPRCPSSPRPPTPNATPSNYSAPPSH